MLGQDYFEKRLGDIYRYSYIAYKSGYGNVDKREFSWELCVDVCGNIIFILSSCDWCQNSNIDSKIQHFSGVSDDGIWDLTCTNVNIVKRKIEPFQGVVLFCLPISIVLEHRKRTNSSITLAKAFFSNFDFFGVDYERGFFVNSCGKELRFQMVEERNELIELIDIDRISNALLSHVSIPIGKDDSISSIEDEVQSLSWFLSFLNLSSVFPPIIEYSSDSEVLQYSIENTVKNIFCRSYIIDNFRINEGIPKAFESCYQSYKILQDKIGINTLIGFLAEINQQKYVDLKLALMLMAYEYLSLKYLLYKELPMEKIGENIQQKLKQMNQYLRFIPSSLMDDVLRGSIRNPLFHQGEIPLLMTDEKIKFFKEYYNLLIRITLRILGYTNQYISIIDHIPRQP